MARKNNRGQSVVEAAVILAVFAAILMKVQILFSARATDFDRAVLSRKQR